jgi:O-antigen/teichoic acid export membrane protein
VLIRQTLAYLPAQLLGPLTQFATAIILTHYLGAADYGLTMLVFAAQELIFLVCLSWWTIYMMRYAGSHADAEAQRRFHETEAGMLVATSVLQIGASVLVILATEPGVSMAFYLGAIAFTLTRSFVNFLSERARKQEAILSYSALQIAAPLGGLIMTLIVMVVFGPKPAYVLIVFALMQGLVALLVARRLDIRFGSLALDRAILFAALRFGLPVVIASSFGWLASNGIRFVVEAAGGPVALGLLSVGWGLATRLAAVAAMVVTAAAYPLAVRAMEAGDVAGAKRQLSDNSALLIGIIAPATFGVIAINEPLVRLLIAAEYHAVTIQILPLALIGASIRNLRMHGWDQLYLLMEAPRPMLMLEMIEALLTLAGAILGVILAGIPGAVAGTTIAAILIALGDAAYLRARYGFAIPLLGFLRVMLAAGLMYLALAALPSLGLPVTPTWIGVGTAIAFGMLVYALAAMAMFPREVRALAGVIRRRSR